MDQVLSQVLGVINIKSYEFLRKLYGFLDHRKNQGVYVVKMFNAAGSNYFHLSENRLRQTNEYLETERRYSIDRAISPEIKKTFPNPINIDGLTEYIEEHLRADKIKACMETFGIPSGATVDKSKLARSLAIQFSCFITTVGDDVDNAVWEIYQTLLAGQPISRKDISGPRYSGDDFIVEYGNKRHEADCYENVHHEWRLKNCGSHSWHGRKLVLLNQNEICPRPHDAVIQVPDTEPGEFIKITTNIDARGFEGNFECKWEMQDADGENCFPNKRWEFNVEIKVTFKETAREERSE